MHQKAQQIVHDLSFFVKYVYYFLPNKRQFFFVWHPLFIFLFGVLSAMRNVKLYLQGLNFMSTINHLVRIAFLTQLNVAVTIWFYNHLRYK